MTEFRPRYDAVFKSLSRLDLQKGSRGLDELGLDDLFGADPALWLGFYTREGLQTAFEKYNFYEDFRTLGFGEVDFQVYTSDPDEHMLRFYSVDPPIPHTPLIELVVRRSSIQPHPALAQRVKKDFINVLDVEWLQMHNPLAQFEKHRPPLPGQQYPGLGLGKQVMEMLRLACKRLNLDGLVTVPSHFHNALFYSEEFYYFDPDVQGLFLALCRDILPQTQANVGIATWAVYWKLVLEISQGKTTPFEWFHDPQMYPISKELHSYFDGPLFQADSLHALSAHTFRVLRQPLQEMLDSRGIHPFDLEKIESWIQDPSAAASRQR